ncbi:MAG: NAD(P)/FAD-dependent oxidoreductase [Marinifilaceae bacterium]
METKYLIVGQGLAGSLLGYEMYKVGLDFRIITAPELSRASEVAAGMYNPLVFRRLTKSWMVDDLLPVMYDTYRNLEILTDKRFLVPMDILKPLSKQEKELWKERVLQDNFKDYIREISDNSHIVGLNDFDGVGRVTHSGYLKTRVMLDALRDFFREREVLIEAQFSYKDLAFINERINWHGISSTTIVFCEGYHAARNPLFKSLGFTPTKGELLQIAAPDLPQDYIINKKMFLMPVGNHRFKVGATYDWEHIDEEPSENGKSILVDRLEDLIDVEYRIENHWAGVRPTVKDRRPILGVHPNHSHVAIFNGLGTKGVMMAPYFAREMLRMLTRKDYQISPEVDMRRFL